MKLKFKKLSKTDSLELFERVLELVRKSKKGFFILRKLRGVHGYCAWDDGIELDYRKDLVPTLVHECIHFLEEDWSETQVRYAETKVMNAITEEDVIVLLKIFSKKV